MKQIKWIVCLLAAALISSCDSLVENYKFDTEGYGTKDWDIIDYCESEVAYQMGSYGKAMRLAGMEDVLAQGNLTCVIPNDDAFAAFVNEAGYESFDEVPAAVWRDLLMYLIFPGEHYCLNMEPGEVRTVNSLRGEPISIMRSENEKSYAMSINGENDLPKIAVESQDYRFKNNIVGQLVLSMPYYKPTSVPTTSEKPEGYEPEGERKSLEIRASEDTFVYNSGSAMTTPQNNVKQGIRIRFQGSSGNYYGMGLVRFVLPNHEVLQDLAMAKFYVTVNALGSYFTKNPDNEANLSVHEMADAAYGQWAEATTHWDNFIKDIFGSATGSYFKLIKGGAKKDNTNPMAVTTFIPSQKTLPFEVDMNITQSVLSHYANDPKDADGNTILDYVVWMKAIGMASGYEIDLDDKDRFKNAPYILLLGPTESPLTIGAVNPLVTVGAVTPFTPEALAINTPDAVANPNGYDFSPQNILLYITEEPVNGTLTRYGVPMHKNQTFTYYEMANGFVKYVRGAEAQPDSFKLKVMDYLDGMVPTPVTISVQ